MKNLLSIAVLTIAPLLGNSLFATQPPGIGHFKGLAFSSATDRHPVEIDGGSLVKCKTDPRSQVTTCQVVKGSLIVTGTEWNELTVKLGRVAVLRTLGKTPTWHYYFKGTVDLLIGEQKIAAEAQVTLTLEDMTPNTVRGFIELPVQHAKNSIEAYLVP